MHTWKPNFTHCQNAELCKNRKQRVNTECCTGNPCAGKDVTIYGDGKATRSFQYVDDLVNGLLKLMDSDYDRPCNLGNPDE
jgi:dTDP-D-glucose 4,6-dehydratase